MTTNPYAPPMAEVADIVPPETVAAEPPFFAVSLFKLSVMCVCTFGVYQVYWFYKNWKRMSEREWDITWPLMRGIFAVFYCYPCFTRIRDYEGASQLDSSLHALPLAIGFIATNLTWRLREPWDWISLTSFLFLLPVQHHANRLNALGHPSHDRNSRLRSWNWLAICIGGPLMLLAIAGLFLDAAA